MLIRSAEVGCRRERSHLVAFYADIVPESVGWVVCGFIYEWVVWGCGCGGGGGAGDGAGGGGVYVFGVDIHIT
jgi:hypothetical protein